MDLARGVIVQWVKVPGVLPPLNSVMKCNACKFVHTFISSSVIILLFFFVPDIYFQFMIHL